MMDMLDTTAPVISHVEGGGSGAPFSLGNEARSEAGYSNINDGSILVVKVTGTITGTARNDTFACQTPEAANSETQIRVEGAIRGEGGSGGSGCSGAGGNGGAGGEGGNGLEFQGPGILVVESGGLIGAGGGGDGARGCNGGTSDPKGCSGEETGGPSGSGGQDGVAEAGATGANGTGDCNNGTGGAGGNAGTRATSNEGFSVSITNNGTINGTQGS